MSPVALNTIAIAIFIFTMSSLLGPLLHLSPWIPAIAVTGLLGFATLDTLSWRGQGVTLLLDWLARFSPHYRDRILRHEAGHLLTAYVLQIPVTNYALTAWDAFRQGQIASGSVSFDWATIEAELQTTALTLSTREGRQQLDRYSILWMAGIAAEQLVYNKATGGAEDRAKLRFVLTQLGCPNPEQAVKERWALLQAKSLLQTHWSAYEALVQAMGQRAKVEHCCEIIQQHLAEAIES